MSGKNSVKNDPIFVCNNPSYGYVVKINHRLINPLYRDFRRRLKIPYFAPLSDKERWQFEQEVIAVYFMEFLAFYNDNLDKMDLLCRSKMEEHLRILSYE